MAQMTPATAADMEPKTRREGGVSWAIMNR